MANIEQKIENGDIEGVKDLIRKDPTIINKPIHGDGRTPLMVACFYGADRRIIDTLIDAGSQVGAKDYFGQTALHWAVSRDRPHPVEILLSRISEVNPRDKAGRTPLHFACSQGHLPTVDILLDQDDIDANVMNNDGDTPLHMAVRGRKYKVVCAMLKQGSVQLDIQNNQKRTPLLEAVSEGHLGMTHKLIALGADINAVDGEGNSCLHIAMATETFNSEDAPLDLLNECCTALKMKKKSRLSGVVVASYLASQGADFLHKNNKNNTPLDLIKDPNLRKNLEAFLQTQCLWCKNKTATIKFLPCGHFVTCETCSRISLKRCLKCGQPVTSRTEDASPKFADKGVQTDLQLLEPTSEQSVNRTFEVKETQTLAEPVVNRTFEVKETQTLAEPVVNRTFEDKEMQTLAEPVESVNLGEKLLHNVAKKLGNKWQQLGRELGIKQVDLNIIKSEFPNDTAEQSFQMLYKEFQCCDPANRTLKTLTEALTEIECFDALERLSLDTN